jgi:hypothetical protein
MFGVGMRKQIIITASTVAMLFFGLAAQAQQTYRSGQHIEPAFEGWRQLEDGSYDLYFGYHNENWEEHLYVPIGENNRFSPGEADRGQPTFFLPRRNRFTFTVNVPEDFGDRELAWTVEVNGVERIAYGTLAYDYVIDNVVIASETGSLGAGTSTPESRANEPPQITVLGDHAGNLGIVRYARVGEPLVLEALVEDDGLPAPGRVGGGGGAATGTPMDEMRRMLRAPTRVTVGKVNGLFLSWNIYRGDGGSLYDTVKFNPPQVKPWEDTRAAANSPWSALWVPPELPEDGIHTTEVTFSKPGTYVLWARADDGGLFDDQYVTVHVSE